MNEVAARARINIPEGNHDAVLLGEHHQMVDNWTEITLGIDEAILRNYGENAGRRMVDVVSVLCYARIAKSAWELCSVAEILEGDFDPVEFGKRCEAIAREEMERYRTATEKAGSA